MALAEDPLGVVRFGRCLCSDGGDIDRNSAMKARWFLRTSLRTPDRREELAERP